MAEQQKQQAAQNDDLRYSPDTVILDRETVFTAPGFRRDYFDHLSLHGTMMSDPLEMVLPGFARGFVGMLAAPGGVGKSMFALQAAFDMAAGTNRLGVNAMPGSVLYLAGEDSFETLEPRIFELYMSLTPSQQARIRNNFTAIPTIGTPFNVNTTADFNDFINNAMAYDVLIIDTLRRAHTCDENDNTEMFGVMNRLEAINKGCLARGKKLTTLILHHSNKGMAMAGRTSEQQSARGASVIVDNARFVSYIAGMTELEFEKSGLPDPDRRGYYCQFGVSKQNYGAPLVPIWYERRTAGLLHPVYFEGGQVVDFDVDNPPVQQSFVAPAKPVTTTTGGFADTKRKRKGVFNGY